MRSATSRTCLQEDNLSSGACLPEELPAHLSSKNDSSNASSVYQSMSILDIIYTLCKRLNWPCEQILQGDCPLDDDNSIDTMFARHIDDGEFVYCIPRDYFSLNGERYNPYDLVYVDAQKAQQCDTFYTVSATYVTKVIYI